MYYTSDHTSVASTAIHVLCNVRMLYHINSSVRPVCIRSSDEDEPELRNSSSSEVYRKRATRVTDMDRWGSIQPPYTEASPSRPGSNRPLA